MVFGNLFRILSFIQVATYSIIVNAAAIIVEAIATFLMKGADAVLHIGDRVLLIRDVGFPVAVDRFSFLFH
jgi:hypothetical protein